jgi:hypothetical protein
VETSIARQWFGKYLLTGTNMHTTVEDFSEVAFYVWSSTKLGREDQQDQVVVSG